MIMAFQDMATSTQALFPFLPVCLKTEPDAGLAALASDAIPVSSPLVHHNARRSVGVRKVRLAAGCTTQCRQSRSVFVFPLVVSECPAAGSLQWQHSRG